MKLVKLSEFAEIVGVSAAAITQAVKRGRIPAVVDRDGVKSIDLHDKEIIDYVNAANGKRQSVPKQPRPVVARSPKPAKKQQPVLAPSAGPAQSEPDDDIPETIKRLIESDQISYQDIAGMTKIEVDKLKSYEQIKQIRVRTQEKRGELVDRKLVRKVFGRMYEIDTNQFLTLKSKIATDLAGKFGCTDPALILEAEQIVDGHVWDVLKHVKYELNKFLDMVGEDRID